MTELPADHALRALDGLAPNASRRLCLAGVRRETRSGWLRFRLQTPDGEPWVEGVYSQGGRGVQPWIEVLRLAASEGREAVLLAALARPIPPGGHLMVTCEGAAQADTHRALLRGVPPAATALGAALVQAGFPRVKFFYLAEGGWEGPQKLWAERPLDAAMHRDWWRDTVQGLERWLAGAASEEPRNAACAARARSLLGGSPADTGARPDGS